MSLAQSAGALQPPLQPRNGHTLKVLGIARISTEHQDLLSLDDQEALFRRWLDQNASSPFTLVINKGRGSGECLDRDEILDAATEIETRTYDLVIAEDLGRIFRRVHSVLFCEKCEDVETRLITLNDHIDTARDNWRVLAGFASMHHELFNADTSERIRRTLRNRFEQGGIVQCTEYGYIKPPGTKSDADLKKDPAAEPVYAEIFRRLEGGASFAEVADWLNEQGIVPGPFTRSTCWTCTMLSQLMHNPILKGVRVRNKKMSKRVNKTGRRKSVNAPLSERLERVVPHLAFVETDRYDRLIRKLDEQNAKYRRKGVDGVDTRKDIPRKRTVWPGQHLTCGVCGRQLIYGGHGLKESLICSGVRQYRCWNTTSVNGPEAADKMIAAFRAAVTALPDFDPTLVALVEEEHRRGQEVGGHRRQETVARRATLEREGRNILAAIKASGHSELLVEELRKLEKQRDALLAEEQTLARQSAGPLPLPSMAEIKAMADEAFEKLAVTSPEFGRLLRRLIPRIVVSPYRLCDGGHIALRANLTFSLAPLVDPPGLASPLAAVVEQTLVVDLFTPPQREAFRERIGELISDGQKQRDIARQLGIKQPVIQRANALAAKMRRLGLTDPYVKVDTPPENYTKHRVHLHPRYRFEPLALESSAGD